MAAICCWKRSLPKANPPFVAVRIAVSTSWVMAVTIRSR
jgi:hypothetical protein